MQKSIDFGNFSAKIMTVINGDICVSPLTEGTKNPLSSEEEYPTKKAYSSFGKGS